METCDEGPTSLMRFGNFLEHFEGPEEVARLHHDDIGFEDFEKAFPSSSKNVVSDKVLGCELTERTSCRTTGWVSKGRLLGGGSDDKDKDKDKDKAAALTKRSAEADKAETKHDPQKSSTAAALLQAEIRQEAADNMLMGKQASDGQYLEDKVIRTHQEMLQEMRQNKKKRKKRSGRDTGLARGPQNNNHEDECDAFLSEPPTSHNRDENDQLDLGFIHSTLQKCLPPVYALRCTLLWMAAMALSDTMSTFGLIGLLLKQTFTMEAFILGIVEYSALPMILLHYIIMKRRYNSGAIWPEVLTGMTPIAQTLGLFYWTFTTFREDRSSTRVHNFVTLNSLLRGVVVSPLMIVAMSYFYLTEVVTPPWQETTTFCDSMHNCVPLGPLSTLLPLIRFGLSLIMIFTGFLEGYQATNLLRKVEIVAFSLPSSTYRAATLILTATFAKEYALILLFLIVVVNISVDRLEKSCKHGNIGCFSKWCQSTNSASERDDRVAERTIMSLVSAMSSIVDISVVPVQPADQERNPKLPEDPGRLAKLRHISTKMSLATFPLFLVANVTLHLLSQFDIVHSNPNNVLSTSQINFLTLYVLYPLAATSFATIIFFRLTFLSSKEWCKYFKAAVNLLSILATVVGLVALVIAGIFPPAPSKIVLSIQTRDRVNFVEGLTWTKKWSSSSNEWHLKNGSFVSFDNLTLKEFVSQYPQNAKSSENTTIFLKTNVTSLTENESFIKIVKPYPPSTDNTSDVACIKEKNEHIVTCEKAVDGYWSPWNDGPCKTTLEVPKGNPCGEGWQMQTRTCLGRKFGGNYCSGRDSNHRPCSGDECPGVSLCSLDIRLWFDFLQSGR